MTLRFLPMPFFSFLYFFNNLHYGICAYDDQFTFSHELNLDQMSRKVTTLAMKSPHLTMFDTARACIMNLLSNDAYMRFQSWSIFRELASESSNLTLDITPTRHEPSPNSNAPPVPPNFLAPRRRNTGNEETMNDDIPLRELT